MAIHITYNVVILVTKVVEFVELHSHQEANEKGLLISIFLRMSNSESMNNCFSSVLTIQTSLWPIEGIPIIKS